MHCTNCGTLLPQGATNCPVCGTPAPASAPQSAAPYDPTVQASNPYGMPASTDYGANPYGTLPQGATPSNPYQQPAQGAYGSYNQAAQPNYGYPPPSQPGQPNYGYPPPPIQGQPSQSNYGYPQGQPQGGYMPPVGPVGYGAVPAVPPRKRSRVGLIIGIILGAILLICIGVGILVAVVANQAGKTITSTATKVAGQTLAPSGKSIVPSAAGILSNPQTSTAINSDLAPTHITGTFTTNQTVYVTFNINSGNQDGYIEAKWYANGQSIGNKTFAHTHTHDVGYFSNPYTTTTSDGAAELYWCTQADCSDAQLAQVVHFTVTSASFAPTRPGVAMIQDVDRRVF